MKIRISGLSASTAVLIAVAALVASPMWAVMPGSHSGPGRFTVAAAQTFGGESPAPLGLLSPPPSEKPHLLLIDIVVDEEFVKDAGGLWKEEVYRQVAGANRLLGEVSVRLGVSSRQTWLSDDAVPYASVLLDLSIEQVAHRRGDVLMVFSGQTAGRYDGYSRGRASAILVSLNQRDPRLTRSLIAHEIGHLLGAEHHEDDEECHEDGCIMDKRGYVHATEWCDHHRTAIRANLTGEQTRPH